MGINLAVVGEYSMWILHLGIRAELGDNSRHWDHSAGHDVEEVFWIAPTTCELRCFNSPRHNSGSYPRHNAYVSYAATFYNC